MFLITGGGSGIGRSLALALAQRGKEVLIVGRREQQLQETSSLSDRINYLCADVSTLEGLDKIVAKVASVKCITALVNNAGVIEPIACLKDMRLEDWHHTLRTNLDAALVLPQKLYSQLNQGRVLNIGSGAAYFPVQGWAAYCSSKAALAMMTRCWQLETKTIAFASVMPGIVDTQMQTQIRVGTEMDPSQVDFYKQLKQQDRLLTTETVAAFLTWLLLDVETDVFSAKEWDIYETSHHEAWLRAPLSVPHWDI